MAARARYEAAIWKLNNRDHFASYGSDDAPGPRMAKYCAAAPLYHHLLRTRNCASD